MFSSLFGNTISFFFLVFGAFRCFWVFSVFLGRFSVLFCVFGELLGELFGAFSFGVSTERGLPHCCDNPLIFELLVLLGALVFLVLLVSLVLLAQPR